MPVPASDLLLIDAGNSRIKWALASAVGVLQARGVLPDASEPEHARPRGWLPDAQPASVWISNVAGAAGAQRIGHWLDAHWPALPRHTISARARQCGVRNQYDTPAQLGSDRWASLIGAHAAYPGEHLLIATCGTATTLESLHADGRFVGGLIAPGLRLMMQSLGQHTAQLPLLADHHEIPDAASVEMPHLSHGQALQFERETQASISQGCLLAQAALIERVWQDWRAQLHAPPRLVLSGGAADAIAAVLNIPCTRHDHLVLEGLARIAAEPHPDSSDAARQARGSGADPARDF